MPNQAEQVIELVVTGGLTLPQVANAALNGLPITLTIVDAEIVGYSAQVGSPMAQGIRPSQRQGKDHVRLQVTATDVTVVDDSANRGGGGG